MLFLLYTGRENPWRT